MRHGVRLTSCEERGNPRSTRVRLRGCRQIIAGRVVVFEDTRRDYGETRMVAIGRADGVFFTIVYTDRDEVRWIITAWLSNRKERARWLA